MSSNAVTIKIGADVVELTAAMAIAKREATAAVAELNKLAKEVVRGGEGADVARGSMLDWAAKVENARAKAGALKEQLDKARGGVEDTGKATGLAAHEIRNLGFQLNDAATMALSGSSAFQIAATQGGQVLQILQGAQGGIGGAIKSIGSGMLGLVTPTNLAIGAMVGLAATAGYVGYQIYAMNNAIDGVKLTGLVNQLSITDAQARSLVETIKKTAKTSAEEAGTIARSFLQIGDGGLEIAKISALYLPLLAKELGSTAPEAAEKLAGVFKDLSGAGLKYVSETKGVSAATIETYKAYVAVGQSGQAYRMITESMVSRLEATREALAKQAAGLNANDRALQLEASSKGAFTDASAMAKRAIDAEIASVDKQISSLHDMQGQLGATTNAQLQFVNALATAAKFDAVKSQMDGVKDSIAQMRAGLLTAAGSMDVDAAESLRSGIARAQQQLLELQQKSGDGLLGRDAVTRTASTLQQIDNAWKGSSAGRVQAEIDAINKTLAVGGLSEKQQEKLADDLARKQKELREAEYSDFTAGKGLELTRAGENKSKIIAIRQEEYQAAVNTYGAESQQAIQAMQAIEQAKQAAAKTPAGSNGAFDSGTKGNELQSELKDNDTEVQRIKELAAERTISFEQERAQLIELAQLRAQTERKYINDRSSAASQNMKIEAGLANRLMTINREVNKEILQDYRSAFQEIGSSVSSSIMGMIQGTMRMRDMARNVVLQMISMFVQAGVRMAANWLAHTAAQVTATAAGETAKTTAVAVGVAARTGLESAGAAAAGAATFSAIFKSIMASAAETFAGIFGFLSPVMGPAAAGPAGAGMATVAAVAGSFAVGAWELPRDMIAQVHQGEMIIPAGPAANMRAALSGSGSGAGAVHVHHATSFNVQAIDAAGVRQFLKSNSKQILRAINDGVQSGSHLGLSKLGSA